jgi:hypothetical protein
MTTYTILGRSGDVLERGLSAREAAIEALHYDSNVFEIRPHEDGEGFVLWCSPISKASSAYCGLSKTFTFSLENDREKAEAEIFAKVIVANVQTFNGCDIVTDAIYDEIVAEAGKWEEE